MCAKSKCLDVTRADVYAGRQQVYMHDEHASGCNESRYVSGRVSESVEWSDLA